MAGPKNNLQPTPRSDRRSRIAGHQEAAQYARTPRGALTPRPAASRLILSALAALLLAGPAVASELWAGSRNGFGNVSMAQFDPATGNMVMGSNVFMDYAFAGQPSQYMGFDRLGGLAFDSDGKLWAASRNGFGNVSLAQFDAATGNMIMGTNVFMDYAFAGQPSQYMGFDRLGGLAFDSDGRLWAASRNGFGNVSLAQFDTATGNMIMGSNVFMDYAFAGQPSQYMGFDRLGGLAFDSDGKLWAASRNGFGNVSLAQFDTATGNMIMGSNVFMDYAFAGQPSQYMGFDRLGGLAFDSDGRLWAASRNGFGNVSLAQFDTATGNMIMGTNVFMDYAFPGQPSQYMGFDRLGAFAFAPESAPAGGVPEPSTWALLITGFFLAGVACRQRRTQGDQVARAAG